MKHPRAIEALELATAHLRHERELDALWQIRTAVNAIGEVEGLETEPACPNCGNTANLETDKDAGDYSCEACELVWRATP